MFLKRIEIVGFKSFAKKTVLEFPEGDGVFPITAIVGPNGSGKSNVADAIRWAIGEQSAKSLRGKKTEDVIFAGTDKKSRLGSASVSLFFENKDKRLPIEYDEVTIARRLHRDGESEYLINGARSRLTDIVDLLGRASIGRDSSAVLTQGMSDAVLSASPLERRALLEEAAGVKQYRIEKDRAAKKLEATLENIAQTDALRAEIEPRLKHLRKEAARAAQAKELAMKLREKQLRRFAFLWRKHEREHLAFEEEERALVSNMNECERRSKESSAKLEELSRGIDSDGGRPALEREERSERERCFALERERALALGKIEAEEERRKPREVTESVAVDRAFVRERIDEIRAHQEKLLDRLAHVESLEELQELRELARVVMTRLADLRSNTESDRIETTHLVSLSDRERAESDARLAKLREEEERLKVAIDAASNELLRIQRALEESRRAAEENRRRLFETEREAREARERFGRAKDRLNELSIRVARIDVRRDDLIRELNDELRLKPEALPDFGETDSAFDPDREEREIIRLKVELEHIGGIDPLVAAECAETEERFAFLTNESEDLKRAVLSLQTVIRETEEKIRREFEAAWKDVDREFGRYFKIIFGGGSASLKKVSVSRFRSLARDRADDDASEESEEASIESGVDIVASPPGKRIANLSMLSGGERSLVALALLFAVISHNPPPFAVLDEVEAALDEANSKRFGDLLAELSRRTQFVAITHNRETMRRAAILYGVTMGDDGVSRVLSLRLDEAAHSGKREGEIASERRT